jgi:phosphomannomutase
MSNIKFGTDGWRARIGEDYNKENIVKVANAIFKMFLATKGKGEVLVGHDRRKMGRDAATWISEVGVQFGFDVKLSSSFIPTPHISWHVKNRKSIGGIVTTASHNPMCWNGIKIKEDFGGSAGTKTIVKVEECLKEIEQGDELKKPGGNPIGSFDPVTKYFDHIRKVFDLDKINSAPFNIANDVMHGASAGYLSKLLKGGKLQLMEINTESAEDDFDYAPEPIPKNLKKLIEVVQKNKCDFGLVNDGDADRIGVIDKNGNFISNQFLFVIVLKYLVEKKKMSGAVARSISTTSMVDKLSKKYGLEVIETPVGFKYIAEHMINEDVLIGGEESGGLAVKGHIPDRDSVFNDLMIIEAMIDFKTDPGGMVKKLTEDLGPHIYDRKDIHLSEEKMEEVRQKFHKFRDQVKKDDQVVSVQEIDGVKVNYKDGSWLLIRLSGTEPLVRVYAETSSKEKLGKLLDLGVSLTV